WALSCRRYRAHVTNSVAQPARSSKRIRRRNRMPTASSWGLRGAERRSGAMREFPDPPSNDAQFGAWRVWKHGDVLEQVAVGVAKEDGRGRHPCDDHGLVRRLPIEVE